MKLYQKIMLGGVAIAGLAGIIGGYTSKEISTFTNGGNLITLTQKRNVGIIPTLSIYDGIDYYENIISVKRLDGTTINYIDENADGFLDNMTVKQDKHPQLSLAKYNQASLEGKKIMDAGKREFEVYLIYLNLTKNKK